MDLARGIIVSEGSTGGFTTGLETRQEGGHDPVHGARLGDELPDGARLIPLTRGYFAIVDAADYERVAAMRWNAKMAAAGRIYARNGGGNFYMHRFITGAPDGRVVDHINGDTLDNRRANLRICTISENLRNGRSHSDSAVPYRGVSRSGRRYRTCIYTEGRLRHLGVFATPEEAARAYDTAAKQFFGPFARLNFPDDVRHAPTMNAERDECRYTKGVSP